MIRIIIIFVLLVPAYAAGAQGFLHNYELEAGVSLITKIKNCGVDREFERSWNLYGELKYKFDRLPVDAGIHYGRGFFDREWFTPKYRSNIYRFDTYMLVGHYIFRNGKNFSPYVGIGTGMTHFDIEWDYTGDSQTIYHGIKGDDSFTCMLRAGVEILKTVKLSTSYKFMKSEYSNLEISLGLSLGGWK